VACSTVGEEAVHLITAQQLRKKLGGRSRSSIHRDIVAGRLPAAIKLGAGRTARAYFDEAAVDAALLEGRNTQKEDEQ
jgi:prophage regulatory protein